VNALTSNDIPNDDSAINASTEIAKCGENFNSFLGEAFASMSPKIFRCDGQMFKCMSMPEPKEHSYVQAAIFAYVGMCVGNRFSTKVCVCIHVGECNVSMSISMAISKYNSLRSP